MYKVRMNEKVFDKHDVRDALMKIYDGVLALS